MPNQIMKYFTYEHLKHGRIRDISRAFCLLAEHVDEELPDCAEKSVALRKILEAKDAGVRAALDQV